MVFTKVDNYLIPCPGPHTIFSMSILAVPGPIDIQSSPVPILESTMATLDENWTWMPSVFILFPGAVILIPCSLVFWQARITMWNIWLLSDISPFIVTLLEWINPRL